MDFWTYVALSSSVLLPATAAGFRARKVERDNFPFLLLLWTMALQEICTLPVALHHLSHAMITNVFTLAEVLLLLWQFFKWHLFGRRLFYALVLGTALFWTWSTFFLTLYYGFNSAFIFLSSLLVLALTLNMMSRQVIQCNGPLLRNALFLAGAALLLFYTYQALVEIFWLFGLSKSLTFQVKVYTILSFVNLITNFIYLTAVLCLPTKRPYFLWF